MRCIALLLERVDCDSAVGTVGASGIKTAEFFIGLFFSLNVSVLVIRQVVRVSPVRQPGGKRQSRSYG